jgi:hypothetical protein
MRVKQMNNASDFLAIYEDMNPLPTNLAFYDVWADDARDLWDLQVGESSQYLEAVLDFRRQCLEESSLISPSRISTSASSACTDWKWLLTVKQIEQRTAEWYTETRNILTASEISAIWKGPRTRAALIMSKARELLEAPSIKRNLAVSRADTGPMDWGVRYEPVVKQILEKTLDASIYELGRIRHRNNSRIAASPDGLFIDCKKHPELIGTLVEIKCPPSRVINNKIQFDYWCQMQLQMEVCDVPSCEFVEVKFKELDATDTPTQVHHGWIILEGNQETLDMRYVYVYDSHADSYVERDGWVLVEKYQWEVVQLRRVTLQRDPVWFQSSQDALDLFWKDVESARQGTWIPPPPQKKKAEKTGCAIVDSEQEEPQAQEQDQEKSQDQEQDQEQQQDQVPSCTSI